MPKYKIVNNPLSINGAVRNRGDIVELDEAKAKAYGDDLELAAGADTGEGEGDGTVDYSKLKKADLEKIAEERGLDYDGLNRKDLIVLLEENDNDTEDGDEDGEGADTGEGEGDDEE